MPAVKRTLLALLIVAFLPLAGCRDASMQDYAKQAKQMENYKTRKILVPKNFKQTTQNASNIRTSRGGASDPLDAISRRYDASHAPSRSGTSSGMPTGGRSEDAAVKKVLAAVNQSLELGPTLVIWIVDRTPSSQKIVSQGAQAAKAFYDTQEVRQLSLSADKKLLTTIVAYDETVDFLLDPPSSDWQQVKDAFDKLQPSAAGREKTFTAIKETLAKYMPFRTTERREVVLAVMTDEAGDDANLVDELVDTTRKAALQVYVIGSPAPWGQANPNQPDPKKADLTKTDDSSPVHGPESLFSERVDVSMLQISYGYNPDTGAKLDQIDSGFGPFALSRLCKESGGQFLMVRPDVGSAYSYRGTSYTYWPSGSETRFTLENVSKYAPDYVSAAEYQRLLTENACRQALVNAAQLPKLSIDEFPDLRFPRDARTTEAKLKQNFDRAQQYAARHAPNVDRYYTALLPGEAAREKLTGPRWQAQYDLAMGRVMGIKARIDGYNSMIAALKRGKTFSNPASTEWILQPADAYETESTIRKMAERAKMYLERVKNEHVGTPWAKIAEEELKSPFGWSWSEA
jgi:hypothetical protein